jgi:hypothetical protein
MRKSTEAYGRYDWSACNHQDREQQHNWQASLPGSTEADAVLLLRCRAQQAPRQCCVPFHVIYKASELKQHPTAVSSYGPLKRQSLWQQLCSSATAVRKTYVGFEQQRHLLEQLAVDSLHR